MCLFADAHIAIVGNTSDQDTPSAASAEIKPLLIPDAAQLAIYLHAAQPWDTQAVPYVLTVANIADILALVDNKQCFQKHFQHSTGTQNPTWSRSDVVYTLAAVLYSQSANDRAGSCQHKLPQMPLGAQQPTWWTDLTKSVCRAVERDAQAYHKKCKALKRSIIRHSKVNSTTQQKLAQAHEALQKHTQQPFAFPSIAWKYAEKYASASAVTALAKVCPLFANRSADIQFDACCAGEPCAGCSSQ